MPGWLQGRLLSAFLWKDINSAELDETELILLLSILFIFYKQELSAWLMQQKWRIYSYLSNYLNEISVAGTDSAEVCQWMLPLDLSDRGTQFSPARLLLAFLEVCTKGIATISHTNGYGLLWKVICCGFFPLTFFFLLFCPSIASSLWAALPY